MAIIKTVDRFYYSINIIPLLCRDIAVYELSCQATMSKQDLIDPVNERLSTLICNIFDRLAK